MSSANSFYHNSWKSCFTVEFQKPYFNKIATFIKFEKAKGKTVLPPKNLVLNAFKQTPLPSLKVVILGQDPYHNIGQAHGLSFSVPKGVKIPPSLRNIFKEIEHDTDYIPSEHGNLEKWAQQGVLLLNSILTVNAHEPASHKKSGWHNFTDNVIQYISAEKEHVVFLLWGKFAQNKRNLINEKKHLILEAPHPSPFSANRGFFGCKHFSKTNEYLRLHELEEINWSN